MNLLVYNVYFCKARDNNSKCRIAFLSIFGMTAGLRNKKEALAFKDLQNQPQRVGLRHIEDVRKQPQDFSPVQFSLEVEHPQNTTLTRLGA